MRKSTKIVKRIFALLLVVLMSIESFAAVVSDNDGSAFITKAEFDSLKNNFQAQIDQYNTSIDSKIDGAIASYLSGINIAKEEIIDTAVSNYTDIKWKRKWELYGGYKKWANATSGSEEHRDEWYTPHYQEFHAVRNQDLFQIDLIKVRQRGGFIANLKGSWDPASSGRWVKPNEEGRWGTFKKFAISCDGSKDDEIILKDVTAPANSFQWFDGIKILLLRGSELYRVHAPNDIEDQPEYWSSSSGTWVGGTWEDYGKYPFAPVLDGDHDPIETIPTTDQANIFSAYLYLYMKPDLWTTPGLVRVKYELNDKQMEAWEHYGDQSMDWNNIDGMMDTAVTHTNTVYSNNFWSEPYYWEAIDTASAVDQENDLKYLMLGKDFTWDAPLYRVDPNQLRSGFYKFGTKYAKFEDLTLNIDAVKVGGVVPWTWDNNYEVTYTNPTSITWRSPNLEKYDFKKITSGIFKYNKNNLKFGQGLPITTNVPNNGKLVIEFDYSIGRTTGDVPTSATGIELDLKSSDFLTDTGTYYQGLLNSETTAKTFHNLEVDNTEKHVKLVVEEIKRYQEVWLRIAPKDTTGGLYAQISNLKAKIDAE